MVLSSGFYRTQFQGKTLHLVQSLNEPGNVLITENITEEHAKFRKDKSGWLSIDDGLLGRYGNPEHLRARVNGTVYRIWVEQRGRDQFGLIPTDESGDYSNKFIGISKDGELTVEDEWNSENGTVWVVSSKLGGPPGL